MVELGYMATCYVQYIITDTCRARGRAAKSAEPPA